MERKPLRVKTKIKAGGMWTNHNRKPQTLKVKSSVRAGGICPVCANHNRKPLTLPVKSSVKAGGTWSNPNRKLLVR